MGYGNTHLLLAIQDVQQEYDPLLAIHGEEQRIHLREGPDLDLDLVARVEGRTVIRPFTTRHEMLDDRIRHPRGRAREAHNPRHASR